MKITLVQLEGLGACKPQRLLFQERFGSSVVLTPDVISDNIADFQVDWFARKVLLNSVLTEYLRHIAPARTEYSEARKAAYSVYDKIHKAESTKITTAMRPWHIKWIQGMFDTREEWYAATKPIQSEHWDIIKKAKAEYADDKKTLLNNFHLKCSPIAIQYLTGGLTVD